MRTPFALLSLATLASALPAQLAFQLPDAIRTGAAHLQSELKSGDYLSKLQGLGEDSWGLVKDVIDEGGKRCTFLLETEVGGRWAEVWRERTGVMLDEG